MRIPILAAARTCLATFRSFCCIHNEVKEFFSASFGSYGNETYGDIHLCF